VTQTNHQLEQPVEPEDLLEATLGRYRDTLKNILGRLLFGDDLRTITKGAIDEFEKDLRSIIGGVEELRDGPKQTNYVKSIDAIQTNIKSVIDNLYDASYRLDALDDLEKTEKATIMIEKVIPSLRACEIPLREAIKQFNT
jgi:hypothetical protein